MLREGSVRAHAPDGFYRTTDEGLRIRRTGGLKTDKMIGKWIEEGVDLVLTLPVNSEVGIRKIIQNGKSDPESA